MHTLEELQKHLTYDPTTGDFRWASYGRKRKNGALATTESNGYRTLNLENRTYRAHRVAWLFITGEWPKQEIDHINGIRNDNRAVNLRDVSRAENLQGARTLNPRNKTGHTGVHWNTKKNCYTAAIMRNGVNKFLGCFDTLDEAVAARTNHCDISAPGKTYRPRRAKAKHQTKTR